MRQIKVAIIGPGNIGAELLEVGRRRMAGRQDDLIVEVALDLRRVNRGRQGAPSQRAGDVVAAPGKARSA